MLNGEAEVIVELLNKGLLERDPQFSLALVGKGWSRPDQRLAPRNVDELKTRFGMVKASRTLSAATQVAQKEIACNAFLRLEEALSPSQTSNVYPVFQVETSPKRYMMARVMLEKLARYYDPFPAFDPKLAPCLHFQSKGMLTSDFERKIGWKNFRTISLGQHFLHAENPRRCSGAYTYLLPSLRADSAEILLQDALLEDWCNIRRRISRLAEQTHLYFCLREILVSIAQTPQEMTIAAAPLLRYWPDTSNVLDLSSLLAWTFDETLDLRTGGSLRVHPDFLRTYLSHAGDFPPPKPVHDANSPRAFMAKSEISTRGESIPRWIILLDLLSELSFMGEGGTKQGKPRHGLNSKAAREMLDEVWEMHSLKFCSGKPKGGEAFLEAARDLVRDFENAARNGASQDDVRNRLDFLELLFGATVTEAGNRFRATKALRELTLALFDSSSPFEYFRRKWQDEEKFYYRDWSHISADGRATRGFNDDLESEERARLFDSEISYAFEARRAQPKPGKAQKTSIANFIDETSPLKP